MAAVFKAVADTAFMFVSATVAATASFRVPIRTGGAPGAHTTRDVCAPGWPGNGGVDFPFPDAKIGRWGARKGGTTPGDERVDLPDLAGQLTE